MAEEAELRRFLLRVEERKSRLRRGGGLCVHGFRQEGSPMVAMVNTMQKMRSAVETVAVAGLGSKMGGLGPLGPGSKGQNCLGI